MPLYTLEWWNRRGKGPEKEVFWAKNDNLAFFYAATMTCTDVDAESGMPLSLDGFLAAGAKELRRGTVVVMFPPPQNALPKKHGHQKVSPIRPALKIAAGR